MRVLVAPDKFRGTLSAVEAASAIATGWRRARPDDEIVQMPMADGGEGTLDALVAALGGSVGRARVSGPLGDPVEARYGIVDGVAGRTAVVELALASGLTLVADRRRDPLRSSSRGTGELILSAVREDVVEVLVCLGGSASTDGGAGIAAALGVRLLDASGEVIGDGGMSLLALDRIDMTSLVPEIRRVRVVVASDVDNPLTGPAGAARVFAPQKGAAPDDVLLLDRALAHYAAVIHRDLGIDVRLLPGAGAAGGAGAGLVAFCGAHVRPGVGVVMEAVGLRQMIAQADVVITGEGRFDQASLHGKAPWGVVAEARRRGARVAVLCGRCDVRPDGLWMASLADRYGEARALGQTRAALEDLASEVAEAAARLTSPP